MPIDPQRLADEAARIAEAIRNAMAVDDDLDQSEVEQLHDTLVACIDAANKRLWQCDQLLRKGLRQEALQECEREPALLDLVTELDFAEWDAWSDYVRQFRLPPQPPLLLDVAADLNAAYVKAQSLDDLMRQYRLLALARSPLAQRLSLLRSIAERDAGNPIWEEDVQLFEAARLREITASVAQHNSHDDLNAIAALKRELEGSPWQSPIPASLTERIDESFRRLTAKSALARLTMLAREIDAAFAQFDRAAAARGRREWEQLAGPAQLTPGDDFSLHVQSAFQWLDDAEVEDRRQAGFKAATATLERMLDDANSDPGQLRRAYAAAERFDEAIPARLTRRFEERLRAIDLSARRRTRLIIAAATIAIVLCGGATFWAVNWQLRARETDRVATTLANFLKNKQTAEAAFFYEKMKAESPDAAAAPAVVKLHAELETELRAEVERKKRLDSLLARCSELLAQPPTWEGVEQLRRELATAKSLAKGDGEEVRVAELRQKAEAMGGGLQSEVDAKFQTEVVALTAEMEALDTLSLPQVQALTQKARGVAARRRVSNDALELSRIAELVRSIEGRVEHLSKRQATMQSLAAIRKSIGRRSEYSTAFKVYKQLASPNESDSDVTKQFEQQLKCLTTADDWNQLAAEWNDASIFESSAEPAALQTLKTLQKDYAGYPGVAQVVALKPYLESVARRNGADGDPIIGTLDSILKKPIFAMYSMERTNGTLIYMLNEPEVRSDGRLNYRSLKSPGGGELAPSALINPGDLKPRADGALFGPAPQRRFAQAAIETLANKGEHPYEFVICKLLSSLYKEPQLDPILRCYLLQTFVELTTPGSTVLQDGLTDFERALASDADLSDQNWVSQDDEVVKLRGAISAQLEAMSNVGRTPQDAYLKNVAPQLKKLQESDSGLEEARWVGAVFPDVDGKLTCLCRDELIAGLGGELWVYDESGNAASPWRQVGRLRHGVVESTGAPVSATEGALVFTFVRPPSAGRP